MTDTFFYQELCETFDNIPIIDTHEHLLHEAARLKQKVDFTTLFSHYCRDDFYSAGMSEEDLTRMYDPDTDLEQKWRLFHNYYPLVRDTSYLRSARLSMEHFYGYSDLENFAQAEEVTRRIQAANRPGLYDKVLKDACHIKHCFRFTSESEYIEKNGLFQYVDFVDPYCRITSREDAAAFGKILGGKSDTLEQYRESLYHFIKDKAMRGVRGIKYLAAYTRTLKINPVTKEEALKLWARLPEKCGTSDPGALTPEEELALMDYFLYQTLEFCDELQLPAVFHTGLQCGPGNVLENTNPLLLTSTFQAFPNVRFVLLHCGIPWTVQAGILAKYFNNVTIDMAWLHIISPEIAVRELKAWMDLLPMNKILGFGGDYLIVEKVYGHLQIARDNLCRAIAEKSAENNLSKERAQLWLQRLLHDNAMDIYFQK